MTNEEVIERLHLMQERCCNGYDAEALNLAIKALEERPTGHWISANGTYYCSCCKHYAYESQKFDFCQDCGADMRKEAEE